MRRGATSKRASSAAEALHDVVEHRRVKWRVEFESDLPLLGPGDGGVNRLHAGNPQPNAFALAFEALRVGEGAATVLNAANEVAVERFLEQGLNYMDIPRMIEAVLASVRAPAAHSLDDVLNLDHEARERAWQWRGRSGRSGHRDTVGTIAIAARS